MTVSESPMDLAWLHCNHCHRSFDHHNRLSDRRLIRSDLHFNFCSCGHVLCDHCVTLHTNNGGLVCPQCRDTVQPHRLESTIPKGLEMYLRMPSLEDAQAVFTFQLGNANQLIKALRAKVASQRDLLAKARHELVDHKAMRERLAEVQAENERLKERIRQFTRDTSFTNASRENASHREHSFNRDNREHSFNRENSYREAPSHYQQQQPGRLSLRSPILSGSKSPSLSRILEMPVYGDARQSPVRPFRHYQQPQQQQMPPPTPTHSGFYPISPRHPPPPVAPPPPAPGGVRRSNYFRQ